VALTNVLCKGKGDEDIKCKHYVDGFKNSWAKDDMFKAKRLPGYIQFNGGEGLPFAEYLYDCPIAGGCADVNDFWNSTLETTHPLVATGTGEVFAVCHKMKYGLCDKRLLTGGLMLRDWDLSDSAAGSLSVFFSLSGLCVVLYLIVQALNILVKGHAAVYLRKAVSLNGYFSMLIGVFVTIMVQSSSITTSVLTPLVAVGLIPLEAMYPMTLGANIGTTITGILAATVVTSNPVQAWQVAICHLMFNVIGILIWYPIPFMRKIPLAGARKLGLYAEKNRWFPIIYILIIFFAIPGVAYGIAVAAKS
jgi:sodium-dependent phosphate cotransporter